MRILFLTHGFNSLSQRLFVELEEQGHEVTVEFDINDRTTVEAVTLARPDLVIAPFLKRAIPEAVWRRHVCLVVHPGIEGDRGPSSLDWAILDGETEWGVTVLQANAQMDAGDIWATADFPMRQATKSSLYRTEATEAAVRAVTAAVSRFAAGEAPRPPGSGETPPRGRPRPSMRQADRAIDWTRDDTRSVLRRIASADGVPGVRDVLEGREVYLHDAHPAPGFDGVPGAVVARSGPAICRATSDGAVWIGRLRDPAGDHPFKLPATRVLGAAIDGLPEVPLDSATGYREIAYEERGRVGTLHFRFHNGAMGSAQCARLLEAYRAARARPTRVIVLSGGPDFWSNGMDLNAIEAADSAADESWRNINAMDDLAEAIIRTESHVTVAALQGNAGAGGVFLARAADRVWMREGVLLSPHYKDMGNLYGSEFWTYLLPRCAGADAARRIVEARLPMGSREAVALGLADERFGATAGTFAAGVAERAEAIAADSGFDALLREKAARRARDEAARPLSLYREEELERMRLNFYGFDPSYHVARYNFVRKVAKSRTPVTIARHRDRAKAESWRSAS